MRGPGTRWVREDAGDAAGQTEVASAALVKRRAAVKPNS